MSRDVGDALTNRRDVRIDESRTKLAGQMTPEDRKAALAEIIWPATEQRNAEGWN